MCTATWIRRARVTWCSSRSSPGTTRICTGPTWSIFRITRIVSDIKLNQQTHNDKQEKTLQFIGQINNLIQNEDSIQVLLNKKQEFQDLADMKEILGKKLNEQKDTYEEYEVLSKYVL